MLTLLQCEKHTLCSSHAGATIGFETPPEEIVYEIEGPAILNVTVTGDRLASNAEVVVRFYTSHGTAQSGQ